MLNGLFLVRTKDAAKGAYVLSMVVQKQPIHHLFEQLDNGVYLVNGQRFGNFITLADLVKSMRSPSFVINYSLHMPHIVNDLQKADMDATAGQAHHHQHGE